MKFLPFCFLLFFSSGYSQPHIPTKSELKQTMKKADYDKVLISKSAEFQSLAYILNQNFDTIIKLAESRDRFFDPKAIGTYCYFYTYNAVAKYYNIKDLPSFVYQKIDSIWKQIGEDNIVKIELCTNKIITITARFISMPNNTAIQHVFIWNVKSGRNNSYFDLTRDTVLNQNCVYRLGVSQNHSGW